MQETKFKKIILENSENPVETKKNYVGGRKCDLAYREEKLA